MRRGLLALLLLLGACSDPTGPCDAAHACEVTGVDLAVVSVRLANPLGTWPGTQQLEAGRELELAYVVRNRGSLRSDTAVLTVTENFAWSDAASADSTRILPLAPGDSVTGTLRISLGVDFVVNEFVRTVRATVRPARPDADATNDAASTPEFRLAIPAIELEAERIGVPRLRANEPFPLKYTVRNASRHASTAGLTLYFCLWEDDLPCTPAWGHTMSSRFAPPVLAPGESVSVERTVQLEPTAAWQDEAQSFGVQLCAIGSTWTDAYAPDRNFFYERCVSIGVVRVRPDFDSCAPPVLPAGGQVTLPAFNCGLLPATTQVPAGNPNYFETRRASYRFHLVAADLMAGRTYALSTAAGTTPLVAVLADEEGERVGLASAAQVRVARTGRYYFSLYSSDPALQLRLAELP